MNNIHNNFISHQKLHDFVNKYSSIYDNNYVIKINNSDKLRQTLVHKSYCYVNNDADYDDNYCSINFSPDLTNSNERLEFLGDRVLELVIIEYLFDIFPDKDEGFLTSLKIKLVKKETLANLGKQIGLGDMILMSSMLERTGARQNNTRLLEDTFESFIGGLYKDQNSEIYPCKAFIMGIIKTHINLEDFINNEDNYKTLVLKEFHKHHWSDPHYFLTEKTGDITGNTFYTSLCVLKVKVSEKNYKILNKIDKQIRELIIKYGRELPSTEYFVLTINSGNYSTKKSAEQKCCEEFINNLNKQLTV